MPNQRPLPVTILAWVYIAVGTAGFVSWLTGLWAGGAFPYDDLLVEGVRFLAVVCGAFMLRGRNWARWLAVAWIAFHVVVSAFHTFREFAIHCLIFAAFAFLLFRPAAGRYFRAERI